MKNLATRRKNRQKSFTIVEVMIVLAIAGLLMALIFIAVPSLSKAGRDTERRAIAKQVYSALLDYYKNNRSFPACDGSGNPCTVSDQNAAVRFVSSYMPDAADPSTGEQYRSAAVSVTAGEVRTDSGSVRYVYDSSATDHSYKPPVGQIFIGSGHWCYSTKSDTGPSANPIASSSPSSYDPQMGRFVILIGLEKGEYYCLDNYGN